MEITLFKNVTSVLFNWITCFSFLNSIWYSKLNNGVSIFGNISEDVNNEKHWKYKRDYNFILCIISSLLLLKDVWNCVSIAYMSTKWQKGEKINRNIKKSSRKVYINKSYLHYWKVKVLEVWCTAKTTVTGHVTTHVTTTDHVTPHVVVRNVCCHTQ